jgi:hypothetical protein
LQIADVELCRGAQPQPQGTTDLDGGRQKKRSMAGIETQRRS